MGFFQIKSYLLHLLKTNYKRGDGQDKPFVYELVNEVIESKYEYYAYKKMNNLRSRLALSKEHIAMVDHGEGSLVFKGQSRPVTKLVRTSSIPQRYGELLFRLVNHLKPEKILELGTSIGISTAYMALADSNIPVYTIEGCPNTAKVAEKNLDDLNCRNVYQHIGCFQDKLRPVIEDLETIDFVFFDGHHQREATLNYFNACLPKVHKDTLFVFDDIYWSSGMKEAWDEICNHSQVSLSIDLFQLGLVFFRTDLKKQRIHIHL